MKNKRLFYIKYKGNEDILEISLHNGYSVIAIKIWECNSFKYSVGFWITKEDINRWQLIDELECITFKKNYKTINGSILKFVSDKFKNGFFDKYINKYEYTIKCEKLGYDILQEKELCEFLEQEKINKNK